MLSSEAIITTDSEEKHHGYTSQEVSQEVWRQNGKQAEWIGEARWRSIGEARSNAFEQQAFGNEARSEKDGGETTRSQKELRETQCWKSKE